MTLNKEKTQFGVKSVKFLGHVIDGDGIHADPECLEAILEMESPCDKKELLQFLGTLNYVGHVIPCKSQLLNPLHQLLKDNTSFVWNKIHEDCFEKIKQILTEPPILAIFDPNRETVVSSDASSYGIGGVLLQKQDDGNLQPVSYISRTLTDTEKRYAQIEREALGIVWCCQKLESYILGMHIRIETDHKPLLAIFTTKDLNDLSPRLQRLRMKIMRYSYDIFHTPGKKLIVADTLSRKPRQKIQKSDIVLEEEITAHINYCMKNMPITEDRIKSIIEAQKVDRVCGELTKYICDGWPEKHEIPEILLPYWSERGYFSIQEGMILKGCRILVPEVLRKTVLTKLHESHFGITKCLC